MSSWYWGMLFLILSPANSSAQNQDTTLQPKHTLFSHLTESGLNRVDLIANLDSIIARKFSADVHQASIQFTIGDSSITLPVEISVRGKFRRKECDLPPLKLEFKKKDLKKLGLKKADSYKLVTHCLDDRKGTQYLLKEYGAYKLYNEVSDSSFRVLKFPITYHNSGSSTTISNWAFIIESNEELEDRLGGKFDDNFGSTVDTVDGFTYEMTSMFNYMIGNLDMNLATCHNVKLLERPAGKKLVIPYDFDYSLMVHAVYAFPSIGEIRNVPRKYNGSKKNIGFLPQVKNRFLDKKKTFVTIFKEIEDLRSSHRGECIRYIQDFFYRLENDLFKSDYPK